MTRFALNRPVTTFMIGLGLCLLGYISWQRLPVQLLPQLIYPEVYLGGGLAGGAPEEVERQLAIPVEAEVATLEGVRDVETTVSPDFFSTKVTFDPGTNMQFAILKLQQKMTALEAQLPENTRIQINRFDTADLSTYLMQLSIRGDRELSELREIAERKVKLRLEQVDGVINVSVGGGRRNNIGIIIDEARCEALGIPVTSVQRKINAYHRQPEHLGQVISAGLQLDVNLAGRVPDLHALRELILDPRGPVRLRDVARVGYSQAERTRLFRVNGKAGVGIFVQKDNVSNMLEVANDVNAVIADLNRSFQPEGLELVVNFSQAELIQQAIDRVKSLAITGAVLALIVLYLFLRNMRYVTILMIAIPVSLLVTANFMYGWGLSINIVSLCGLALAIGMLVDNGIVVLENIFSHYQRDKSALAATLDGTREVSRSIFAATGTTVLVFLPVLFVESDAQLFVRELALSVIFPLSVSLVVALTLVPLLARWTLSGKPLHKFGSGRMVEIYRILLKSAIRHRVRTISVVAVLLLCSVFIGVVFILRQSPPPPPDRLDVYFTLPQGTTLQAADELVQRVEKQVLDLPDLREARTNITAEEANISATFVKPNERSQPLELDKIKSRIKKRNENVRHIELTFDPPSRGGRPSGGSDTGGLLGSSPQGLRLRGHDLTTLQQVSAQIQQTLKSIEDIDPRSVRSELRSGAPEIHIIGDRLRLAIWGLNMQQVMTAIWGTRAEGTTAATPFFAGHDEYDIQLQLKDVKKRRLQDLQELRVVNPAGQLIPLKEVAEVRVDEGPANIVRFNQQRQVKITYRVKPEAEKVKARLEAVDAQLDLLLQEMRLPRGFTLEKLEEENKQTVYYWMLAIGAVLIFMFLAAQFESLFSPFVILGTVPTAMIGALFTLALSGTPLSLGQGAPMALLGLIVLLGIVVNNGIILLDRIAVLQSRAHYRWQRAVMVASQNRVRPILMTSATTILGILPLALKQGTEFELWPPFAITVLGGLLVSALSTLVFIPVLYVGLEQTRRWLLRLGWPGLIAGTAVAAGLLYGYHQSYESVLYTSLLALPVWFGVLGLIFGVRKIIFATQEKARLQQETLQIKISNLTKIYGAPGRFAREWARNERHLQACLAAGTLPWDRQQTQQSTIWLAGLGVLIGYLHTFFTSGFWLFVLTLATLAWIFAARELYYRWRFLLGKPPKPRRRWRRWRRKKKAQPATQTAIQEESISPRQPDPASPARPAAPVAPQAILSRNGGVILSALAIGYLHLRIGSVPFTVILLVSGLLMLWLRSIAGKIARGRINPELPEGRLRRLKRGLYVLVQHLPLIRPPRPQVVALHGVDLDIGQGMFGLLGPNGAGKTTLMRTIVGVLEADRGSIKINDRDLSEHRDLFHGAIGYLPQDFGLYENMTPAEYLNYHATVNGLYSRDRRQQLIEQLLRGVGLRERRNDKIKTFSGGMKQRVGIAQTLLHLPQIIVVDEPTAGLDPRERIRFRNLLSELAKDRIVIFSTHIVEDISSTCHDLAVLDKGRVIFRGAPETMLQRARGKVFEATLPEEAFAQWRSRLTLVQHSKAGDRVRMRFISEQPLEALPAKAVEPTLEDAYVLLLGRQAAATSNGAPPAGDPGEKKTAGDSVEEGGR